VQEGNALYSKKEFDAALAKYDEAIEIDPTEMSFHLNKAAVYLEKGDFENSIQAARKAIEVGRAVRADFKNIAKLVWMIFIDLKIFCEAI
jgi:stress-induced-phosphoprotein 1